MKLPTFPKRHFSFIHFAHLFPAGMIHLTWSKFLKMYSLPLKELDIFTIHKNKIKKKWPRSSPGKDGLRLGTNHSRTLCQARGKRNNASTLTVALESRDLSSNVRLTLLFNDMLPFKPFPSSVRSLTPGRYFAFLLKYVVHMSFANEIKGGNAGCHCFVYCDRASWRGLNYSVATLQKRVISSRQWKTGIPKNTRWPLYLTRCLGRTAQSFQLFF